MKVQVYHYDMEDPSFTVKLHWRPEENTVREVWNAGGYSLAYEPDVEGENDTEIAEQAFMRTQDTGEARSTSVGDLVVIEGRAYAVMPFGFGAVSLEEQ